MGVGITNTIPAKAIYMQPLHGLCCIPCNEAK